MMWAKHKGNSQGTPESVTTSFLPRSRWNVVDLITVVNREFIPSYYFLGIDMTAAEQWRCWLKEKGNLAQGNRHSPDGASGKPKHHVAKRQKSTISPHNRRIHG
jgi:hypothetical protein